MHKTEMKKHKIGIIDRSGSASIPALTTATILTYNVAPNHFLEIMAFSNYANDLNAWGYLTWVVKVNSIPQYPFDAVLDQKRIDLREVGDKPVAYGGSTVTVDVTNSHATDAFKAGVNIKGDLFSWLK